jgi:hypothetical protein
MSLWVSLPFYAQLLLLLLNFASGDLPSLWVFWCSLGLSMDSSGTHLALCELAWDWR